LPTTADYPLDLLIGVIEARRDGLRESTASKVFGVPKAFAQRRLHEVSRHVVRLHYDVPDDFCP
jgi:hypothetical protein